jgi:hypothetical protein
VGKNAIVIVYVESKYDWISAFPGETDVIIRRRHAEKDDKTVKSIVDNVVRIVLYV